MVSWSVNGSILCFARYSETKNAPSSGSSCNHLLRLIPLAGISVLWLAPATATAQTRPSYCDQTPAALLRNLQTPYTVRDGAKGKQYCEGLLVRRISLPPPAIISVKQAQPAQIFAANGVTTLTWCDDPASAVHISLRSTKVPYFGLDAVEAKAFSWPTDEVSAWQPRWDNFAALGTRRVKWSGREYDASIPLRVGPGYTSTYTFLIRAQRRPSIKSAVIRLGTNGPPQIVDVSMAAGPANDVWKVDVSFRGVRDGVYSISFSESAEDAGLATTNIIILHKLCSSGA